MSPDPSAHCGAGEFPCVNELDHPALIALQAEAARSAGVAVGFSDPLHSGGHGPALQVIPAGRFLMGSSPREFGHQPAEAPQRYVTLTRAYALGRYVVTAEEFARFQHASGWRPRRDLIWARDRYPVINIRPADARAYLEWLSGETGQRYRLPTEAQWEHAARAGSVSPFAFGDSVSCREVHFNALFPYQERLEKRRWYLPRCLPLPWAVEVGSLPANLWGLHEMHGNVQEMTTTPWQANHGRMDAWGEVPGDGDNPRIAVRGGSWFDPAVAARSAARRMRLLDELDTNLGFRVLRELD
ncbi:MAG TPA: SUMF1/EgtB/PvdO family nonheme iron enzyme [Thioalkalivibrio sp.]|nr:SUMF1/EgtB/PvdO family nonheme iron enzyme [Thioalkalivibrio sp.]